MGVLTPWRRKGADRDWLAEATRAPAQPPVKRFGFEADVPRGGANEINSQGGTVTRRQFLEDLLDAYTTCTWSSACVDAVARTTTAGGLQILPRDTSDQTPGGNAKLSSAASPLRALLDFVNPHEDIRQLLRGVLTDLQVFGDAFLEVVWFLNSPVALYSLDCPSMITLADEHGNVTGYVQRLDEVRKANFKPHEIIHISLDSPRGNLYGVGPTEKTMLAITTWLFAAGLEKEEFRKGLPPRIHANANPAVSDAEVDRFRQRWSVRNLGIPNIGNPVVTKGIELGEFQVEKIAEILASKSALRDEICSGYGTPPAKVGIIESGNLGGGTGTSQDKTFRVNTCGPLAEIVLEKINYHLVWYGYGLTDLKLGFGDVDWRDDQVVETIRDIRLRNGSWTLNRLRAEIGEPPVDGGDQPVLVDRQNLVAWTDLAALSKATVAAAVAKSTNPGLSMQPGVASEESVAPKESVLAARLAAHWVERLTAAA